MKKNDWKKRDGVVYSTDASFAYSGASEGEEETLEPGKQQLRILIDRSGRAGKQVTIVSGFVGSAKDREALCKTLKTRCGTGGSVKELEILIQGDCREKILQYLVQEGYKARKSGGN
ncbi:MAG: translation initiation factor [Cytophagales bacterium]|nr:translation initiation factor [Cytophagales bacterium]